MDDEAKKEHILSKYEVNEGPYQPDEKELVLGFTKAEVKEDGNARIYTNIGSGMRNLLKNPRFKLADYKLRDEKIYAIRGLLPVGCLKISKFCRSNNLISKIFS